MGYNPWTFFCNWADRAGRKTNTIILKAGRVLGGFLFKCPLMSQWELLRGGYVFPAGILSLTYHLQMPFFVI